jgi:hypothetical protein
LEEKYNFSSLLQKINKHLLSTCYGLGIVLDFFRMKVSFVSDVEEFISEEVIYIYL